MHTPTTPEGLEKWDHLGWPRDAMPLLARALDRQAEDVMVPRAQHRPRILYPPDPPPPLPWPERG